MTVDKVHPFDDSQEFVKQVIRRAFHIVGTQQPLKFAKLGDAWLSALREAFWEEYKPLSFSGDPNRPRIAAFGGKPPLATPKARNPSGIQEWKRWEFMHDVSVVELEWIQAAYRGTCVPVLTRALWQVESELALNSTEVAEDLSKLKAGRASYKLLIVARTTQKDAARWAAFIERAATGITGTAYVAEIPTYASMKPEDWCTLDKADIEVRLLSGPKTPQLIHVREC